MRIGIDLGGSKIEGALIDRSGRIAVRHRVATPKDYDGCVDAVVGMVTELEAKHPGTRLGICAPGTRAPDGGRIINAHNTPLQGEHFLADLERRLGPRVRMANDANCFALSEASDGAARGARVVAGIIVGTGVGAGLVVDGRVLPGAHQIAGEWGHNPQPEVDAFGEDAPKCSCGRRGCVEAFISGTALARQHAARTGQELDAQGVCAQARAGDGEAMATLGIWYDRMARSLATLINVFDPDVLVFGGGLSAAPGLCEELSQRLGEHIYAPRLQVELRLHAHGDASGLRGAAWLWPKDAVPLGAEFVAPLGPSRR